MPTGVYVVFDLYFSDESRFCLDYHDGRRRVWRQKNERFKNCCVAEHGAIGDDLILMDDNARHHRARIVNEYLQQETIERMDWPAKSPDYLSDRTCLGHPATSDFKSTKPAKLPAKASRCTR